MEKAIRVRVVAEGSSNYGKLGTAVGWHGEAVFVELDDDPADQPLHSYHWKDLKKVERSNFRSMRGH